MSDPAVNNQQQQQEEPQQPAPANVNNGGNNGERPEDIFMFVPNLIGYVT